MRDRRSQGASTRDGHGRVGRQAVCWTVALTMTVALGCGSPKASKGDTGSSLDPTTAETEAGVIDDDTAPQADPPDSLDSDSSESSESSDSNDDASVVDVGAAAHGPCPAYAAPVQAGSLDDPRMDELSGLVASRQHDDVLWGHNDSGEKHARMFALDGTGALRMVLRLGDIVPTDTEDIAVGPCATATKGRGAAAKAACLYLGDVGDNGHVRTEAQAYRIAEPTTVPQAGSNAELKADEAAVEVLRWTYPARPDLKRKARAASERPDVEAMVVLADGRIVLLDKRDDGVTNLFRVQPSQTPTVAEALGTLVLADGALMSGPSLRVTAADLSDDGSQLLVRCYFRAYQIDVGGLLLGDATAAPPALPQLARTKLTTGFDVQGESIAWARQGGFWHGSEGASAPVFFVGCAAPK